MHAFYVEIRTQKGMRSYRLSSSVECEDTRPINEYLTYRFRIRRSPNTVRRETYALLYYLKFLDTKSMRLDEVRHLSYEKQYEHFCAFLSFVKQGAHSSRKKKTPAANNTANTYLKDVFGFFRYLDQRDEDEGALKVLSGRRIRVTNAAGVQKSMYKQTFHGYLKGERHEGRVAKEGEILTLLRACSNIRDQLLLLLLSETGFRVGEILGLDYLHDIDYEKRIVKVYFREANENGARAKYAEARNSYLCKETFAVLLSYLATYRDLLAGGNYLFVNIYGRNAGKPLNVNAVYAMLRRLEGKTGIKVTPHMLRHYFANERRKSGWELAIISTALGHRHLNTTVRYLHVEEEELEEASKSYYEKHTALYPMEELL